jgi:ABC-type multidrug transport system fused ATPase/permease subunit
MAEAFTFVDATALVSQLQMWEEKDKAISDGYEKFNNEVIEKYAKDKEVRIGAKSKTKFWFGFKKFVSVDMESVEFKDISFGYDDNMVLENISFKVNKGERAAVTGASGIGKTTLVSLIMRFYEPSSGEIYINGMPMGQIRTSSLRKAIGMVSQDILLFNETIRYNLQLGTEYTDAEIWNALDKTDMWQAIESLPQGLDTKIGASVGNLSGGQKQRLMLARLFLKKTQFIILDEATSALDIETESRIIYESDIFSNNTTALVISHRPEAIRHCDFEIKL